MTEKKSETPSKAGAVELEEADLDKAAGGHIKIATDTARPSSPAKDKWGN